MPNILKIADDVKKEVDEFRPYVPLIAALRKKGMTDRHWAQISEKVGFEVKPTEDFTLTKVLDLGLQHHTLACVEIGERAGKEYTIEVNLDKMEAAWEFLNFKVLEYKKTETFILGSFDDIWQILDE